MILKIVYWLASITQVPNAKRKFSKSFSGQNIITTHNRRQFTPPLQYSSIHNSLLLSQLVDGYIVVEHIS